MMMSSAKQPFFSFLFAATFFISLRNASAGCISSESVTLLKFKNGLTDPSNRLQSWDGDVDCCSWYGVICHNLTGHVVELHLRNTLLSSEQFYNLTLSNDYEEYWEKSTLGGNVSESLLDLKHLQYLDLSNNYFQGNSIPEFFGLFPSLRYLNLSEAGFQGLIPSQLGNLSNLQYLVIRPIYFDDSVYVEELEWVSRLSSLKFLDLNSVNLYSAFDWQHILGKLPSLVELHLSDCQLTQIPPISNIISSSLSVLDLSFNNFYGFTVPVWISNLTILTYLDLSYNRFSGPIPSLLQNLTSLRTLDLGRTGFNSSIPDWLGDLTNLEVLNLSENEFEGEIPSLLQNLTLLRTLDLSYNRFNSSIPDWLGDLTHLELLNLRNNEWKGEIPSSIGNLTSLNFLHISSNFLEEGIPTSFKNLCSLRSLSLSDSGLRQQINEVIEILSECAAHNLESLVLSNSRFSGYLTTLLEKFKNLVHLDLSQNLIFGSIPPVTLGEMTSLTYLDLSFNKLNGSLPISFGGLAKLKTFFISSNSLEGEVSEIHFENLTSMKFFDASENHLSLRVNNTDWIPGFPLVEELYLRSCDVGPQFPSWIRHLNRLKFLDLSNSKISSTFPTWFHNFSSSLFGFNLSHNHMYGMISNLSIGDSNFTSIDLSSNYFEGPLPFMSSFIIILSHNLFSGSIHNFLCNKMYLSTAILVLNDNLLLGEIPDCWTYWTNLEVVKLSSNNFIGNIPTSIGSLTNLQMLNIRDNNLVGDVPSSLQNCASLSILDLGENELTGEIPSWIGKFNASLNILNFRGNKFHGQISKELCSLTYVHILDLADNKLNGTIPTCVGNLSGMFDETSYEERFRWSYGGTIYYTGSSSVVRKGTMVEYSTILNFVRTLDLSDNKFVGEIPKEITSLSGLQSLNLSYNILTGRVPKEIGAMKNLESLDLSQNRLSGEIPPSMSSISSLSTLNLSNNNLSGHIPTGTQLQSFEPSSFSGNNLCGPPLKYCNTNEAMPPGTATARGDDDDDGSESGAVDWFYFYVSLAPGFVVGFWCVVGPLAFNKRWRISFFNFLELLWGKLWVWFHLNIARFGKNPGF